MLRGNGWHAPFGASPPFWLAAANSLMAWWLAKLGRIASRERYLFVIAGREARCAVFGPNAPAIHAGR